MIERDSESYSELLRVTDWLLTLFCELNSLFVVGRKLGKTLSVSGPEGKLDASKNGERASFVTLAPNVQGRKIQDS